MKQSQIFFSNSVIIWITRFLQIIPQFIIVPFLISHLGDSGYGVYALVWPIMASVDQMGRSLQSGIVKYAAQYLSLQEIERVNRLMSSSVFYSILLGFLASTGTILFSFFYGNRSPEVAASFFIIGGLLLFIIPLTPFVAIIQSKQRYYVEALANVAQKYLGLLGVFVWFTFADPSVESLVLIMAATLFVSRLLQIPVAYKLVPGLDISFGQFYWDTFKMVMIFGGATIFIALSNAVNNMGTRWIMGSLVSTTFVGHLAIILLPGQLISQFVQGLTVTVMPATSSYEATKNYNKLRELLIRAMRYTTMLSIAGLIAIVLFVSDAYKLWLGTEYIFLGKYATAFFISMVVLLSTSTAHHMLKGLEKLKVSASIAFVGKVIIPFGLIFLIYYLWGTPYIAVTAGLVTGNIITGFLQLMFAVKTLKINLGKLFNRVYLMASLVAGIIIGVALGTYRIFDVRTTIIRLGVTMFSLLLYVLIAYFLISSETERKQYKELFEFGVDKLTSIVVEFI